MKGGWLRVSWLVSIILFGCGSDDSSHAPPAGATDAGDDGGQVEPDAAPMEMKDSGIPVSRDTCGNARIDADEECDDGNVRDGDGCDVSCHVEAGFHCVGTGAACEECGNGIVESSEECDDGNGNDDDGCSTECAVEEGWVCPVGGQACENCGNGVVEANERCDEGALADGIGCAADCRMLDTHYTCAEPGEPCVLCGDGIVDAPEVCDDGNTKSGDGCVFSCIAVEPSWSCPEEGGDCELCGNGMIAGSEECDDGNFQDGDGCSTECRLEPGAHCLIAGTLCGQCGNGYLEFTTRDENGVYGDLEECDDGNMDDDDGCSSGCAIEDDGGLPWLCPLPGYACARCGDGLTQAIEACDNGTQCSDGTPCTDAATCAGIGDETCMARSGDGCAEDCSTIEPHYLCTPGGGKCVACGNGIFDTPLEQCDDTNVFSGDGCDRLCQIETNAPWVCPVEGQACELCGNGVVEAHEVCDDGNRVSADGCAEDCQAVEQSYNCFFPGFPCARCGDGQLEPGEQCDEGDLANPDQGTEGCNAQCAVVAPWSCPVVDQSCQQCGDGILGVTETCEDGNTSSADGCSSVCQIEAGYDCSTGTCLAAACGDGFVAGNEQCDDGNLRSGDGCSFVCQVEQGWSCEGSAGCRRTICGDGIVDGTEQCDDGNALGSDGCSASCAFEPGYQCPVPSEPCIAAECGNGVREGYEACDDGNLVATDGCDASCQLEPGYYCPIDDSPCLPTECGDGLVQGLEACDDDNTTADDGCDASCVVETFYRCSGEPSSCNPILDFVAVQRFTVANVSPESLVYDPERRAFAGHKSQDSKLPIELCLDGTLIDPNDFTAGGEGTIWSNTGVASPLLRCALHPDVDGCYELAPRPVSSGTLVGAAYDPFTDHQLFLSTNGSATTLTDIPRDFDPMTQVLTDFQVGLSGLTTPAELTVGEDGDLYVADAAGVGVVAFPRRRDGNLDIVVPDCGAIAEPNCTSFQSAPNASQGWLSPVASGDKLAAVFTVPGENLIGMFNAYLGATSYVGTDARVLGSMITTSEYFSFYDPSLATAPPLYGRSGLPGLLFDLGTVGVSYTKHAKSAETAPDGGSFILCPENTSEPCQLFARQCQTDADCSGIVPGTRCETSAAVPYCHAPGDARDDSYTVPRNGGSPLDVLANDTRSESSCLDPGLTILSVCGDGVAQQYEIDNPTNCPSDSGPRGTPSLTDGEVTYDAPDDGSCGFVDKFTYTVDLGGGFIDTATVRVQVACICGDGVVDSNEQCDDGESNGAPGSKLMDGSYARCGSTCFFNVYCGDGYIVFPEECDDLNTDNGDGCSKVCTLESVCGNGMVEGVEECDDGNMDGGDTCNPNCTVPVCGDGNVDVQVGETCDDGNTRVADGCDNACHVETVCGNGLTELGEQCDDGGTTSGDGCSQICTVENICGNDIAEGGEVCDGPDFGTCPSISSGQVQCLNASNGAPNICLCANYCGDGNIGGLEECDAGPSGSTTCRAPETQNECTIVRCGDGIVDGVMGEECDDGNSNPADGCTNDCKVLAICGNDKVEGAEQCDDGNNISGDGCSSACKTEATMCGNGILEFTEQCDDGNTKSGDGCSSVCLTEAGSCGNGTLDLGEQCDDGNVKAGDGCDVSCQLERCGNGVVDADVGEQCDDGNRVSGDGCSPTCLVEVT